MLISAELLLQNGFSHEQFPDGWFWYIRLSEEDPRFAPVAHALGYTNLDLMELSDTLLIQCDDKLSNWMMVFGPDVGPIEESEVHAVLEEIRKESTP